jgi:hypothetical protein
VKEISQNQMIVTIYLEYKIKYVYDINQATKRPYVPNILVHSCGSTYSKRFFVRRVARGLDVDDEVSGVGICIKEFSSFSCWLSFMKLA